MSALGPQNQWIEFALGTRTRPVAAQEKPGAGQERAMRPWNHFSKARTPEHETSLTFAKLSGFQTRVQTPMRDPMRERKIESGATVPGPGRLGPMRQPYAPETR